MRRFLNTVSTIGTSSALTPVYLAGLLGAFLLMIFRPNYGFALAGLLTVVWIFARWSASREG